MTLSPEAAAQRIEELERENAQLKLDAEVFYQYRAGIAKTFGVEEGLPMVRRAAELFEAERQVPILQARISELESALQWREIEKEKPPIGATDEAKALERSERVQTRLCREDEVSSEILHGYSRWEEENDRHLPKET